MQLRRLVAAVFLALLVLAGGFAPAARGAQPPPLRVPATAGAVAADNADASRAGAEVLKAGGNAVDAAVATALALGVVHPMSSGLGGGGFAVVWVAKEKKAYALDFREVAPARATADMFVVDGKVDPQRSRVGGLAVAVPGEPAGLALLSKRFGKLGLKASVQPAARLAQRGFPASRALAQATARWLGRARPASDDPLGRLLQPKGKPLAAGDKVVRADLGRALLLYGQKGAPGFYGGPVGAAIVKAVGQAGGLVTAEDLAGYQPIWREPLAGRFRGRRVLVMPPPAGGVTALEALQVLDARPPLGPKGLGSSASLHEVAEAFKHAFADRARLLGDPAFVAVPTERLAAADYAAGLAARISDGKVLPHGEYGDASLAKGGAAAAPRDHGTSHLCVVDGEGNAVALTTTVNLLFGSGLVAAPYGVVLNDEMDDFVAQPGTPNAFGLVGNEANAVAPGKRPLSSMTPTLVLEDDRVVLCAGASGGPMIVTATVQTLVNVIDHGADVAQAVGQPRIHAQWMPDLVLAEKDIPADVVAGLERRGHKVKVMPGESGVAQAIVVKDGFLEAAADPRKGGAPAAP